MLYKKYSARKRNLNFENTVTYHYLKYIIYVTKNYSLLIVFLKENWKKFFFKALL